MGLLTHLLCQRAVKLGTVILHIVRNTNYYYYYKKYYAFCGTETGQCHYLPPSFFLISSNHCCLVRVSKLGQYTFPR